MDTQAMYDEMLDELTGDICIGSLTYSASHVLRMVDPIAYQVGLSEFVDSLEVDEPDTYDGLLCADCLMVVANADGSGVSDLEAWESRVEAHNPTDDGRFDVVVGDADDPENGERTFSRQRCDYCGTQLAGYRHPAVWLERAGVNV
jgi:hypothetical protein